MSVETEYKTLRYRRPMMHGSAVRRLQEMLSSLAYDCGDVDGVYGPITKKQVCEFQRHQGLVVDGICGPITWTHVLTLVDWTFSRDGQEFSSFVDIKDEHELPRNYSHPRQWSAIDGVTLHQTGCEMPSNPLGWSRVNAHIGVTQEGKIIILNDPKMMIWHAQGLSHSTIGIEIEGNYCGVDGDMGTLWKGGGGPHHLNEEMKNAFFVLFYWLLKEFGENNQNWRHVFAHRQSSLARRADPGEEIWREVGLNWSASICNNRADGGDGWSKLKGRPIPKQWDDDRTAKY